jgi:hypothetical protein
VREARKQQVIIDVMAAVCLVIDNEIATGDTSRFPDYGSPELVAEAVHECRDGHKDVQAYFVRCADDAYRAFRAAVEQN